MSVMTAPPPVPVGEIKRFGPFGSKYEVGRALHPAASTRQNSAGKIPPPLDWLYCANIKPNHDKGEESWTL